MKETTLAASEFKAKCLKLLDEVAEHGRVLVITKRGRPVARVLPLALPAKSRRGAWKGVVRIRGDIVHFDSSGEWEILR